jgi:hypothetical protein
VILNVKVELGLHVGLDLGVLDLFDGSGLNDLLRLGLSGDDLRGLSLGGNNVDVVGQLNVELDLGVKAEGSGVGHLELGVIGDLNLVTVHILVDNAHLVELDGFGDAGGLANLLARLEKLLEGLGGGDALNDGLDGVQFKAGLDG